MVAQGFQHGTIIGVEHLRKIGNGIGEQPVQIGARLGHRDTGLEASEDGPGGHTAVAMTGGGGYGQGGEQVDLRVQGKRK